MHACTVYDRYLMNSLPCRDTVYRPR